MDMTVYNNFKNINLNIYAHYKMDIKPVEIMFNHKKYKNFFEILTAIVYFMIMSKNYIYQYSSEIDKYLSKYEQYKIVKKHIFEFISLYWSTKSADEPEKELDNISEIIKKME